MMDYLSAGDTLRASEAKGLLQRHSSHLGMAQRHLDAILIIGGALVMGRFYSTAIGLEWQVLYGCLGWILYRAGAGTSNFYGSWRVHTLARELSRVGMLWGLVIALVVTLALFAFGRYHHINGFLLPWGVAVGLGMLFYRSALRVCLHRLREMGFNIRRVAVVGCGTMADRLIRDFEAAPWMGFRVAGQFVTRHTLQRESDSPSERLARLREVQEVIDYARSGKIDRLYITWGMNREPDIRKLIEALSDSTVSLYLVPDLLVADLMYSRIEPVNGVLTVSIYDTPAQGPSGSLKRIEDIVVGALILSLIAIPMLVIALAVKLTSKGPVFFKQKRYGLDGRSIEVYKFRSMKVMENGDKVVQAKRGDDRITPVGAFLRRTSLDELPQFINVLQGRMSIVGPRPHAVSHNEEYRGLIRGYMLRHKVKPGITGWAQINGWRGETDTLEKMQKRVEFDHEYIRQWSLLFDLRIIFLTIFKGFINKNAY
ncbi:undecaprenyl-phosphate glucose phosphotransferase [Halomonas stenophila]|uniref:Putative colanic acid biosynthesis UDP-glucose lipid carrier transferase n=1 Tax=Halomonas stenophila TaxID=795312 RepID=A0A7W5ERK6_9GAMM|nr:undecaprenyl-phosphate glucose phosphotransferase [Halomonas stenophila]MBB3229762.1 putative colanic acid biosynthesis UDP-glucose lipid carrier transferase [Halomonas stenophila]